MPHKKSPARRKDPAKGANRVGRRACFSVTERIGHAASVLFARPTDTHLQQLVIEQATDLLNSEMLLVLLNDGRRALVIVETFENMAAPGWGTMARAKPTKLKVPRQNIQTAQGAP